MQRSSAFLLRGGIDMVTPAIGVDPGRAVTALNYFASERGYQSGSAYERYDGRPSPSAATWVTLRFKERTALDSIEVGDTVTGASASGLVIWVTDDASTPFFADEDDVNASSMDYFVDATELIEPTSGYLALVATAGVFVANEPLSVGGSAVAWAEGPAVANFAPTIALEQSYAAAAADHARLAIMKPPGEGPVRGLQVFAGELYAFRNQVSGGSCKMFKATTGGWVEQSLGHTIAFQAGTGEVFEGEILSRGGVTATIRRVVVTSGSWSGDNAAGYLAISGASGTFTSGAASTGGSGALSLLGAQTANTIARAFARRQFSFAVANFGGTLGTERMYVAYGRGRAFEWDGVTFCPITSPVPLVDDIPVMVRAFANHLFLFFLSGTMLFSEIGNPLAWTTTGGAGEIALGSSPRDALSAAQTSMMIICRAKVMYLTGTSAADFAIQELSDEAGGWARTAQNVATPLYCDRRGIREMAATDTTAGFRVGTMSGDISPAFDTMEKGGQRPWCSIASAAKSRYILFCNDVADVTNWTDATPVGQTIIAGFFGRARAEFTMLALPVTVWCGCDTGGGEEAAEERLYFGGADGMVYQMDRGTSHDGAEIQSFIRLPFNMLSSPQINKRFHSMFIEVDALGLSEFAVSVDFDYGDGERSVGPAELGQVSGGGGYWGEANWAEFVWSAPSHGVLRKRIDGGGQSCSIGIASRSKTAPPHALTAARLNWTPRGFRR